MFCVFEGAWEEGAGGHCVASAAEFGGDFADVEGASASQRASDSAVFELDEQRRGFDRANSVTFVDEALSVTICRACPLQILTCYLHGGVSAVQIQLEFVEHPSHQLETRI